MILQFARHCHAIFNRESARHTIGDVERHSQRTTLRPDVAHSVKDLKREAQFQFLLEREPNTSILREFDLSVINRYFPEFEAEMAKRLAR